MRSPTFYGAVYGIIYDDTGNILTLKRSNTGHMDGWYGLPSGHIEGDESFFEALQRETKEEVDLDIEKDDAVLIHMCHRVREGDRKYIDVYFKINTYSGTPKNSEPDKHSEVKFLDWKKEEKLLPSLKIALEEIEAGNSFSEIFNIN